VIAHLESVWFGDVVVDARPVVHTHEVMAVLDGWKRAARDAESAARRWVVVRDR